MNKHLTRADLTNVVPLVAVPNAGDTATYFRLHEMRQAAYALQRSIDRYLNTPALPACATYREERMALFEHDVADMRKVLRDS